MSVLKKITVKKVLIALAFILLGMQAFRIDTSNPTTAPEKDFLVATNTPTELATVIRTACYDCHSNETTYPWYTKVAPVSWWIKHHINDGKDELNFSEWADFSARRADHKLKECIEMVEEGEMPMDSYTIIHGDAKLSESQKTKLMAWFKSLRNYESDKPREKK